MAEVDFTSLTGNLTAPTEMDFGVTTGVARPASSVTNNFVLGFNSQVGVPEGVLGKRVNQANYDPTPVNKGGSVRACIQRGSGGVLTGYAPFIFIGLQGPNVTDQAYILGLSDEGPTPHLVLRKGALKPGGNLAAVPSSAVDVNGVLRRSTADLANGVWYHVRLDMVVNLSGDTLLDVYANDLDAHPIGTTPSWQPVAGMAQRVDAGVGRFTSGRMGLGFWVDVNANSRRAFFDHFEAFRQL